MYPANAFDSRLRLGTAWFKSDKISSLLKFSGWRPAIAFLYLFLVHSLLRLSFFLTKNYLILSNEKAKMPFLYEMNGLHSHRSNFRAAELSFFAFFFHDQESFQETPSRTEGLKTAINTFKGLKRLTWWSWKILTCDSYMSFVLSSTDMHELWIT